MAEIKPEYDRAVIRVERMSKAYDRKAEEYETMRHALRLANRYSGRAKQDGQQDELERWRQQASMLEDQAMPQFIGHFERLYEELEKKREIVASLRREIANAARIPASYEIKVVDDDIHTGVFHLYFGGIGKPDGVGHAHYVYGPDFKCRYQRQPARRQPLPRGRR